MSYFECRHGERYFPFGEGGRDNLLRGLRAAVLAGDDSSASKTLPLARTYPYALSLTLPWFMR